jgi:hypothetical protein
MTNFLETALDLARRGFHVLPLIPRTKRPLVFGGCNAGTRDPEQIALWWKRKPDANIGIDCGHTNLIVMDADHGLACLEDFIAWRDRNGLPPTYTVRSGRRLREDGSPEFGVQMYFRGSGKSRKWILDGCSGDFKSIGGLVVAPPSIHPDSGEAYEVLLDLPIADRPDMLLALPTADGKEKSAGQTSEEGLIETDNRNDDMCSFIGKIRKQVAGLGEPECLVICLHRNERYAKGPMPDEEVEKIVSGQYQRYPDVGPDPVVTIGSKPEEKKIMDWRERYHSKDEMENAPPISFLIDGFLQCEGITGLAAPVRERKSLIALNVAHALLTGEKLFDHFAVTKKPTRVLYLCPEVSLGPFTDRLRKIGLMSYVGETLFCRTLSAQGHVELADLKEELPGSVVILDTAIRFIEGKESDSADIRVFADTNFALLKGGADSVLLLHHSPKDSLGDVMTLENALRGSGDLGAFLCCCWGTKLQDPANPYQSASYLENLKQRDFESQPFEVTCGPDCRLHIVGTPTTRSVELKTRRGKRVNGDGKDEVAIAFLKAHPELSVRDAAIQLKEMGIKRRGKDWVSTKLRELSGTGVRISETP